MDKPHEFNAERLRKLIAKNELMQILEELAACTEGKYKNIYNEILQHMRKFNEYRSENRLGIIDKKDSDLFKSRLANNLLELIDDLEKLTFYEKQCSDNKGVFQIKIEGDINDFDENKRNQLLKAISEITGKPINDLNILEIYEGSVKIIIELNKTIIREFINGFKTNLHEYNTVFSSTKIFEILDKERIYDEIVLNFYRLLLDNSNNNISVKEIIETLRKYSLFEEFKKNHLKQSNLSNLYLYNISLKDANLYSTDLNQVNLRGANLSNVYLSKAQLNGANLIGANLKMLIMINGSMDNANLSCADLEGAKIWGVSMENVNLNAANLNYASLIGSNLKNTSLIAANLTNTKISEEQLLETYSLFECKGLSYETIKIINAIKPELFEDPMDGGKRIFKLIDI